MVLALGGLLAGPLAAPAQEAAPAVETGAAFTAEGQPAATEPPAAEAPLKQAVAPLVQLWDLPEEPDSQVRIRKVYDFLNDPQKTSAGRSPSLAYEFKYFDHGAITAAQRRSRQGQYFIVTWSNNGPAEDMILRLDYRQSVSRDKVNTLEIPYKQARGTFKGTFSVTGDQYFDFGDVHSWRISLVRNGRIIAQERSFVW